MKDPTLEIQKGIRSALTSALDVEVIVNPSGAPPYVIIGDDTMTYWSADKQNDTSQVTHTMVAWDTTMTGAKQTAADAIEALTNRTSPLQITGFSLSDFRLDFRGNPVEDKQTDATYWGVPFRIRYWINQG